MKKILATLFTTAMATPSVNAQSSITIFGAIDQYVEATRAGNGTVKRVSSGGAAGSRLGFRGTEDLGSGLSALFIVEHDFLADSGGQVNAKFWNRQTLVGLGSRDFGTLTFGRQYTPHFAAIAFNDPAGFVLSSAINYFAFPGFPATAARPAGGINGTLADSTTRRDNAVQYASPMLSGFQAKLFVSASEGTDARVLNGSLGYSSKGLFGTASYLRERTTYVLGNTDTYGALVVGYDFGFVKPAVTLVRRRGDAAAAPDIDAWQIGASMPLGPGALAATYAKLKNKSNDSFGASAYGLRYDYYLSKRTRVYAGYTGIRNNANAAFTISGGGSSSPGVALSGPGVDPRSGYLGVSHTF